jgi:hypothetical protein
MQGHTPCRMNQCMPMEQPKLMKTSPPLPMGYGRSMAPLWLPPRFRAGRAQRCGARSATDIFTELQQAEVNSGRSRATGIQRSDIQNIARNAPRHPQTTGHDENREGPQNQPQPSIGGVRERMLGPPQTPRVLARPDTRWMLCEDVIGCMERIPADPPTEEGRLACAERLDPTYAWSDWDDGRARKAIRSETDRYATRWRRRCEYE